MLDLASISSQHFKGSTSTRSTPVTPPSRYLLVHALRELLMLHGLEHVAQYVDVLQG